MYIKVDIYIFIFIKGYGKESSLGRDPCYRTTTLKGNRDMSTCQTSHMSTLDLTPS